MKSNELELVDYLKVIWKKKWLILIGTLAFLLVAILASFLTDPVYEIDCMLQPGKIFVQNQSGNFEQVIVEDPKQIADKVIHRTYNLEIAAELGIDVSEIPEMRAENIKDTFLVRMWIRDSNVALSRRVLSSLMTLIKNDVDDKIDIEIANLDSNIRTNEIDKERRLKEIEILNKKLEIVRNRRKDIMDEMKAVNSRISELEEEQLRVLKNENKSDAVSLGLLLYSTEIQRSLINYDILNEKLSDTKLEEEDIHSSLQKENAAVATIENVNENLKEQKGRIDHTKIVKTPEATLNPVLPKIKLNIVIAIVLGLVVFVTLSFFLNYLEIKKFKWSGR